MGRFHYVFIISLPFHHGVVQWIYSLGNQHWVTSMVYPFLHINVLKIREFSNVTFLHSSIIFNSLSHIKHFFPTSRRDWKWCYFQNVGCVTFEILRDQWRDNFTFKVVSFYRRCPWEKLTMKQVLVFHPLSSSQGIISLIFTDCET